MARLQPWRAASFAKKEFKGCEVLNPMSQLEGVAPVALLQWPMCLATHLVRLPKYRPGCHREGAPGTSKP